jgi:hypothetical protein
MPIVRFLNRLTETMLVWCSLDSWVSISCMNVASLIFVDWMNIGSSLHQMCDIFQPKPFAHPQFLRLLLKWNSAILGAWMPRSLVNNLFLLSWIAGSFEIPCLPTQYFLRILWLSSFSLHSLPYHSRRTENWFLWIFIFPVERWDANVVCWTEWSVIWCKWIVFHQMLFQ